MYSLDASKLNIREIQEPVNHLIEGIKERIFPGGDSGRDEEKRADMPKKSPSSLTGLYFNLGDVLLSHTVTHAVPLALKGLTAVFGMGTGVSPSLWSPRNLKS